MRALALAFLAGLALWAGGVAPAQQPAAPAPPPVGELRAAAQRQGALFRALAAQAPPQRPGVTDVYVLAVAADGELDVFLSEAREAAAILERRYNARGVALLSNNPATWLTTPLASPNAIGAALRVIGQRMDPAEDVLVVFLTAHGTPQGVVFATPPLPQRQVLAPWALKEMMDAAGVRHRLVIVSACYSGTFIEPLKSPQTAVVTASRRDRTSFGCAVGREWTYFGDAFFAKSLATALDLDSAFATAERLVRDWEKRDGLSPASEPQIWIGDEVRGKLKAAWGAAGTEVR